MESRSMTNRVSFVLAFFLLAAGTATCQSAAGPAVFGPEQAEHLLNRAGFGGTPDDIAAAVTAGCAATVDRLLDATGLRSDSKLPPFITEDAKAREKPAGPLTQEERKKLAREMKRNDAAQLVRFRNWWVDRMIRSDAVTEEKMTLFWAGHFTSSQREVKNSLHMIDQNQTLRDNALGT